MLYDTGCTLNKATFGTSSAITSGTTTTTLSCGLTQAAGFFNRGSIKFISGALSGVTRTVKSYTTGSVSLLLPLPATPAVGDTFIAYAGCDKQQSTCQGKFNNLPNFRGAPYIPVPITAV